MDITSIPNVVLPEVFTFSDPLNLLEIDYFDDFMHEN